MTLPSATRWGMLVISLLVVIVLAALSLAPWWLTVVVGILWGLMWGLMLLGDELNMWGSK